MTNKKLWIVVFLLVGGSLLMWHWFGRASTEAGDPDHAARNSSEIAAAVARVERRNLGNTLTIAGEFKAFQDVDVHAKVAGYIRTIFVDVGDHVREGQTLAVLESPSWPRNSRERMQP